MGEGREGRDWGDLQLQKVSAAVVAAAAEESFELSKYCMPDSLTSSSCKLPVFPASRRLRSWAMPQASSERPKSSSRAQAKAKAKSNNEKTKQTDTTKRIAIDAPSHVRYSILGLELLSSILDLTKWQTKCNKCPV